ncbi:hypothetical protein [Oricola thermophila]|nr:hypothetical protein [Oricola thermophila]
MTKGEYAARRGVTPARISQYIADGKIGPSALKGEGRSARIIVEIADRHLAQRLDASQALGANGAMSRAVNETPQPDRPAPHPPAGCDGDLQRRPAGVAETETEAALRVAAQEKAEQAKLLTAKMRRQEALETGRYILAADARAQIARATSAAFRVMEAGIRNMAADLAAQFELSEAEVSHALVKSFRAVRERAAADFKAQAEALPEHVEDGEEVDDGEASQ